MRRAYSYRVTDPPGATLRFISTCVKCFYGAWNMGDSALFIYNCARSKVTQRSSTYTLSSDDLFLRVVGHHEY